LSITETRPPAVDVETNPAGDAGETPEARGLAGWLTTPDHRRIGRLYVGTALLSLLVAGVVGALLGAERVDTGLSILDSDTFGQVYSIHGELAVFGFLVPLFLGVATAIVPRQVGSPDIAFPRGSATGYWTYLVGLAVLVGAYLADGGVTGDEPTAVDLHLLALGLLNVATLIALVSILATIVSLRAPGMTLERAPLFSWAFFAGGGMALLAIPVLLARLLEAYVGHHFGGAEAVSADVSWFFAVPQLYVLAVPAAGVAAEAVAVFARKPLRLHLAGVVILGAMAVLSFGAFAEVEDVRDDFLYVALGIAAVLPPLALLGLLADTVRQGTPVLRAPLLLGLGAAFLLFLGALAGGVAVIEPLDLQGTTWISGQLHLTLYGGATLGAFAALWYWAPKLWGVELSDGAGKAVFALSLLGALALAVPDLVTGLVQDLPLAATDFDDESLTVTMNVISTIGAALAVLGALVAAAEVARRAARPSRAAAVPDDPWGGHTLEWRADDAPVVAVTSPTPLLTTAESAA
jgi:cytochrome c oxidase subunit 1